MERRHVPEFLASLFQGRFTQVREFATVPPGSVQRTLWNSAESLCSVRGPPGEVEILETFWNSFGSFSVFRKVPDLSGILLFSPSDPAIEVLKLFLEPRKVLETFQDVFCPGP